ncbi:MAG: GNAT family N-acetyltransferase [Flavobacteriales bacterium]|nr:GNAT family N-acetyltransferase [Flavobacteriales bacterium]NNK80274.1 GNAT family N-acetyltransferase [Flavobacteriales bacterium]
MDIRFEPYDHSFAKAFKELNEEWIKKYFRMEEADHKALDNPQEYIINKGGDIIIGILQEEVVGVCALIKMKDSPYDFELAKMAISPNVQGKGLGFKLGQRTIERAKELGAKNVYLESNTKLTPAINLYRKLGFVEVEGISTPYDRCNIKMELTLD